MIHWDLLHVDDRPKKMVEIYEEFDEYDNRATYYLPTMGRGVFLRLQTPSDVYWFHAKLKLVDLSLASHLEATK